MPPSAERARAELEVLLAKGVAVRRQGLLRARGRARVPTGCELCEELGDRVRSVHALRGLWAFYEAPRAGGRGAGRRPARRRRGGLEDRVVLAVREYVIGATLLFRGEPTGASPASRRAEALRRGRPRRSHQALRPRHRDPGTWSSRPGAVVPRPARAGAAYEQEGLEIARRVAHPFSLAQMLAFSAVASCLFRDWAAAEALGAEAREISTRYGVATHLALGTIASGIAVAARGDTVEGPA